MPTLESLALLKSSAANKKLYDFRPERVRAALKWLKKNNRFYEDIDINYDLLNNCFDRSPPTMQMSADEEEDFEDSIANGASAANDGSVGVDQEVLVMTPERLQGETEGLVEALTGRKPVITRPLPDKPTYISPHDDKHFYEKAYPHLFPFGFGGPGDDHGMKEDAFCDHVLCSGGDRRFQRCSGFIFTNLRYSMRRKISGVCAKAASKFGDGEDENVEDDGDNEGGAGGTDQGDIDAATVCENNHPIRSTSLTHVIVVHRLVI